MMDLPLSQGIVTFDISLGLIAERECLRRVDRWWCEGFAVHQTVKKIQDMGFCRNAGLQRHIDGR